eukprot:CAMPEP_0201570468 /NCGR_PEP_ID=MMETSP0190_2-20130828/12757_1 /ASSEMBLY_ACC=CAM_ASM_000263 /TAXON_ID=37353 /ORGANISM="Rosalina sp." /LENGTH=208 /DNA_ID=CAMNT_0047994045 /DNA_START=113 /DNA_END=735 /DNA_ORIENTATION=+
MADGDKTPVFVHASPQTGPKSGSGSPETLSLTGNAEVADIPDFSTIPDEPINNNENEQDDRPGNIQLTDVADNGSSSDNEEQKDNNNDNNSSRKLKKSSPRHKKGYDGVPTKSYSELMNASMYSLGANESIIGIGDDEDAECDDGWPHFEPLDGPYPLSTYKKDIKQVKNEVLSGLVVSFAQVPEAVAFSFLAGVDPFIGLHAAWIVG